LVITKDEILECIAIIEKTVMNFEKRN